MAVNLSFIGGAGWQFFDDTGNPLSGGKLYTYAAGTTTPLTTYTSRNGNIPNSNPIILDAAGRTPEQIWSTEGLLYKYVIKNVNDVLIRTWDDIGGTLVASNLAQDLAAPNGSSLVGYLSYGTAAVAQTVQTKLRETLSVIDFGADPTGVTDSTTAIQNALNAQAAATISFQNATGQTIGSGPTLLFPKGRYLISATLNIISQYAWLSGEQASLKKAGSFTGTAGLQMAGNAWRLHIEGLQFEDFSVGLYLDSSNLNSGQIGIHNCGFFGNTDRGIWLDCQSSKTIIQDCMFRSNKHDLWIERGDLVVLDGGWIQRLGNQLTDNYDGAIVNYGVLYARNILTVPQPETVVEPAWFKNYGYIDVDGVRFGGESGGIVAINNFNSAAPWGAQQDKSFVAIRNCPLYVGSNSPAIRLFELPNMIALENNTGLTGSNASAIGWSSSLSVPEQTAKIPTTLESRYFNIYCANNIGQLGISSNLLPFVTSNTQLRLWGDQFSQPRNLIFDYIETAIGSSDVYGTIEWKGYDASNPAVVGRRGAIIGRSVSTTGGFELAFQTGANNAALAERLVLQENGILRPGADNTQAFGTSLFRWSVIYAATGTINTSDARDKQNVLALDAAEYRVAKTLKQAIKKYRFKDAVAIKGDAARVHIGVLAQDVVKAFSDEGLDAFQYGIVCYDSWPDTYEDVFKTEIDPTDSNKIARVPTGEKVLVKPAHDKYGIRYDELLTFILAAL